MCLEVAVGLETAEFFEVAANSKIGLVAVTQPGGTRLRCHVGRVENGITLDAPGGPDDFSGEVAFEVSIGMEFGLPLFDMFGVGGTVGFCVKGG